MNTMLSPSSETIPQIQWPSRHDLMGVGVSVTDYDETVDCLIQAARSGYPAIASFHSAHAIVTASREKNLREQVNSFDLVAPDGQPVRWAMNWLYQVGMKERVYGPESMLRLCEKASSQGLPIYLYGAPSEEALEKLINSLKLKFPTLKIAGAESPPFRELTDEEDATLVERINQSGARLLFIGLGCPKQDRFAYDHRDRIRAVQLCVGAAFDFHAQTKAMAPAWMQRNGLEWLFRVCSEPRRLGKRYLTTNSLFVWKFARQWLTLKLSPKRLTTEPSDQA